MKLLLAVVLAVATAPALASSPEAPREAELMEMLAIAEHNICGPEGFHDWTGAGPTCEREGWDRGAERYADDVSPLERAMKLAEELRVALYEARTGGAPVCDDREPGE